MNKLRIIFFGSGEFAAPILDGLLHMAGVNVVAVVTQTDKPAGRNQELKPVPVKEFINDNYPDLKVYTPVKFRLEQEFILENEKPELIIVADYGQILPEFTINYPKFKSLNVHGSILPDLRGAVPIPIAILKGYKKTGVSIPIMTPGLDDGPVLAMTDVEIEDSDTTETLKLKLAKVGAQLLERTIPQWVDGKLVPLKQNEKKATIAGKTLIEKSKAQITKDTSAETADRMVRAFYPWPVAWCEIDMNGKVQRLKIFEVKISENSTDSDIGKITRDGKKLILNLDNGSIELLDLQLEGKKRAGSDDYLYISGAKLVS